MARKRDTASIPCPSLLMELGRPSLGPFPVAILIPWGVAKTHPYVMPLIFADPSETASTFFGCYVVYDSGKVFKFDAPYQLLRPLWLLVEELLPVAGWCWFRFVQYSACVG